MTITSDPHAPLVSKNGLVMAACGCCIAGRPRPVPILIPRQPRPVSSAPPLLDLYRKQGEAFL
jgi:hypothetical protein